MTIAAVATPHTIGGISVIRLSGEEAFLIADKIFFTASGKKPSEMSANTCLYGKIKYKNEEIDDGVITVFHSPKSYTGENVAEISCHGGIYITNKVLGIIIENGAEPAGPGEFTKRAFLNGKMSLTEAEAVADIISSEGEFAVRSANAMKNGQLYRKIKNVSDSIIKLLGELGAWVDYPEEDIPAVNEENIIETIQKAEKDIVKLLSGYNNGKIIREGIDTVLAGRPNVGKSTLMNLLSGCERSIVTDIAGTTRDIVEEKIRLGNIVLRLSDTAGIRKTDDVVENAGVERAFGKIENADLIIAVFDNSQSIEDEDRELIKKIKNRNVVAVINKCDCNEKIDKKYISDNFKYVIEISALNDQGTEDLKKMIEEIFHIEKFDSSSEIIVNERQKKCLEKSLKSLKEAEEAVNFGETLDAVTVLIDESAGPLLELTGEKVSEAVVNEVFANFCVGK